MIQNYQKFIYATPNQDRFFQGTGTIKLYIVVNTSNPVGLGGGRMLRGIGS